MTTNQKKSLKLKDILASTHQKMSLMRKKKRSQPLLYLNEVEAEPKLLLLLKDLLNQFLRPLPNLLQRRK
jgi:hypothetical protein